MVKKGHSCSFINTPLHWEFPGGPVVRTWHFHFRGPGSIRGQGTKIRKPGGAAKNKKQNQKTTPLCGLTFVSQSFFQNFSYHFTHTHSVYECVWFLLFFWPHRAACGILVPRPRIEPEPLALEA